VYIYLLNDFMSVSPFCVCLSAWQNFQLQPKDEAFEAIIAWQSIHSKYFSYRLGRMSQTRNIPLAFWPNGNLLQLTAITKHRNGHIWLHLISPLANCSVLFCAVLRYSINSFSHPMTDCWLESVVGGETKTMQTLQLKESYFAQLSFN